MSDAAETKGPDRALSVCHITARDWTFKQDVRGYAAAGVRGLSVWWDKLQAVGPKAAARLLADAGLRAVSMVGLPPLLAGDAGMSEASFSTMMSALDACHVLGIDRIGLVPGPSRGRSVERLDGLVMSALQNLAPYAIAREVVLALEPVRNPYLDYLYTLEHADRLVNAAERDAVGLLFDAWHLCHEPDLWAHVAASAPRISLVHVSDWREPTRCHGDRLIPGEGVLPLQQIDPSRTRSRRLLRILRCGDLLAQRLGRRLRRRAATLPVIFRRHRLGQRTAWSGECTWLTS
jgi:sugar phosphate isomerase/epimerase